MDLVGNNARRSVLKLGLATAGSLSAGVAGASAQLILTPWQTSGPFFPENTSSESDFDMTRLSGETRSATGVVVSIFGRVLDQTGKPLAGALIDVWQANANGRYAHTADRHNTAELDAYFQGWAQLRSDQSGAYQLKTIIPGAYPVSRDWSRPPHIHFKVNMTGYRELTTQMYFSGQPLNDDDRILNGLSETQRRQVIVPLREMANGSADSLQQGQFDIVIDRA